MCKLSMLLMLRSTLITYAGTIWWIVCMTHYIMLIVCKTTKTSWKSLHKKYKTENVGIKKFVVSRFLDYMMVDSKNVTSQVQESQVILHDIQSKGMTLSKTF